MELTGEILQRNGFSCNHPERVLKTYYYDKVFGYGITAQQMFDPLTNSEFWYVVAQNGPNNSASVTGIKTLEDFQSVINLAKIDLLIYNE